LRVLTVTHFFESHGGGIERVAAQLCRQFDRIGHESVWAASRSDAAPTDLRTVPLPCVNPIERFTGLPMPLPLGSAIRNLAREVRRSDAVVVHDALYATSITALLLAKVRHKPVVLIQHIGGIPFASKALRGVISFANAAVTRPMLRGADARVFISDTVRRDLLGNDSNQDAELLFNGVDTTIFHPAQGTQATPVALSGIHLPASRRILFVGRYVEKKGLAVIRALASSRPDLEFFLVGTGPIQPAEWRLPNVHDLGPQNQLSVADLYRWADLLLLPSVGEGYPLVIQEAMACGLPVICGEPTNRADPDARQWLRGVLVDLADPAASAARLAEAIADFEPSDEDRGEMSRYAAQRYNWEAMAQAVLSLARERSSKAPA
jgi:glycosyltransferase involved in cell wall biosynthesis